MAESDESAPTSGESADGAAGPLGSWAALFQQSSDAVFLLNARRRLRYVNPAWQALTQIAPDVVLHEYCRARKQKRDLTAGVRAVLQAMAPPDEAIEGRITERRRPVPPARLGPPWWDVTFVPIRSGERVAAILGVIRGAGVEKLPGKGLTAELIALRERAVRRMSIDDLFGTSPEECRLARQARSAAQVRAPLWIVGAAGTGKESLARAVHSAGPLRERAFVCIDGAGLQPYLIRSQLFGHNGIADSPRVGMIYLKSPQALPADLQAELADWNEQRTTSVRVAVGIGPGRTVGEEFRTSFGICELQIPTMAERKADLQILAVRSAKRHGIESISADALSALFCWDWSGNWREWHQVLADCATRITDRRLETAHLPQSIRRAADDASAVAEAAAKPGSSAGTVGLDETLEKIERRMIAQALRRTRGDRTAAAELLKMHRSRFLRRLQVLGLDAAKERSP